MRPSPSQLAKGNCTTQLQKQGFHPWGIACLWLMIVDGSVWGRVSQAKEGRQGGCSHHPEHSAALVDDPVSPWRALGRLAAIPHCGITSTKCSSLALVGRGGSLQHSLLGGPVRQELCPAPSQGKAGRFLFCLFSPN